MRLAVIPARGGSKRIPRKNIKAFAGQPMIAWSIAAAKQAGIFDRIIVTTDDEEVASIAEAEGAEAPFRRPADLADDHTPTVPVIGHAIDWVEENWGTVDAACCLYATAPFVSSDDLVAGLKLLEDSEADYAFPVTSFPFPVQRAAKITADGRLAMLSPEHALTRSQDLEETYHDVGQFYWGTKAAWLEGRTIIGPGAVPLIIPRHRAQDIDTPEDWERAELMFQVLAGQGVST